MARGFADAGVLRALSEEKIPIGAVLGTEMGALIGSIYALEGNINRFEWGLLKIKDEMFEPQKGFFNAFVSGPDSGERLEHALSQIFGDKTLSEAKLPVRLAIQPQSGGGCVVAQSGRATQAVRAAIAAPMYFAPKSWNSQPSVAADQTCPFLVHEAKALGIGPVVVVDSRVPETPDPSDLKDADLVIRPDLRGIGPADFQKRTEAAFRGKKSVQEHRDELRRLVGLPKESAEGATE
jgi:NTE family protein